MISKSANSPSGPSVLTKNLLPSRMKKLEVTPFEVKTALSKSPRTVSAVATSMARSWSEPCQLVKAAS